MLFKTPRHVRVNIVKRSFDKTGPDSWKPTSVHKIDLEQDSEDETQGQISHEWVTSLELFFFIKGLIQIHLGETVLHIVRHSPYSLSVGYPASSS